MKHTSSNLPFDRAAADYDRLFTTSRLARRYRETVWRALSSIFGPGDQLLELGCGTGEDAVWLARRKVRVLATDSSEAMLELTRRKAAAAGVDQLVSTRRLDLGNFAEAGDLGPPFDGVLSNFGALNCLPDRRPVAHALAGLVRSRGIVVLVVMAPICPWELAWHLVHGEPGAAVRRLRKGAPARVAGRPVRVWYPSPGRLRREFEPDFRPLGVTGIGCFLPPPYLEHLEDTRPGLIRRLATLEARWNRVFPFTWFADHCMMVLERRS